MLSFTAHAWADSILWHVPVELLLFSKRLDVDAIDLSSDDGSLATEQVEILLRSWRSQNWIFTLLRNKSVETI